MCGVVCKIETAFDTVGRVPRIYQAHAAGSQQSIKRGLRGRLRFELADANQIIKRRNWH